MFRESYRKEVLAVLTSNRIEILAPRGIEAEAIGKEPQEVVGLRTQKELLPCVLVLSCT